VLGERSVGQRERSCAVRQGGDDVRERVCERRGAVREHQSFLGRAESVKHRRACQGEARCVRAAWGQVEEREYSQVNIARQAQQAHDHVFAVSHRRGAWESFWSRRGLGRRRGERFAAEIASLAMLSFVLK
jgi:hypothetical protein